MVGNFHFSGFTAYGLQCTDVAILVLMKIFHAFKNSLTVNCEPSAFLFLGVPALVSFSLAEIRRAPSGFPQCAALCFNPSRGPSTVNY
jgi:hypothetical protein